jgi:DNA polymerase III epsilon subunit-like protein
MKFHKDILIIDFEGLKHPVQVGAILLDRKTLEEKDSFMSYIYANLDGYVSPTSGISQETINDAPKQTEVGEMLREKFGTEVFIGSFVQNLDINHFKKLMGIDGTDFRESGYDFHILDIWPLAYVHALKQGYTGGIGSEELFQYFGAKPRGLHNALEDCRITADVLRKIVL